MSPQRKKVSPVESILGEAFEMINQKRVNGRFPGKSTALMISLCALIVVAFFAVSIHVSWAMPIVGGSGASPVGGSTYIVLLNTMAPADAQTVINNVEAVAVQNGGSVVYQFSLENAVAVSIPDAMAYKLQAVPGVKYVEEDHSVQLSMDQVVNQVDVRNLWNNTTMNQQYGNITGKGVIVCVIDSGVDDVHPDLQGKIAMERDFTNILSNGQPATTAPDYNGHGTFVASEIVGSGVSSMYANGSPGIYERTIPGYNLSPSDPNYNTMRGPFEGIAPGASLDCFKVIGATMDTSAFTVERALDYATNSTDMGSDLPRVISMSLDSGVQDPIFTSFVEAAVNKGFIVVVSAGNDGPAGSVETPADAPDAITVGSVNRNDTHTFFSAHGPTLSGVAKPDIMAVGDTVIAADLVQNNGYTDGPLNNFSKYYTIDSGTSMATPEVSAVVALMLQVNPNLTPAQVKELLMLHARLPADYATMGPMYEGAGILDAYAVLLNETSGNIPTTPASPLATIMFNQSSYQVSDNANVLDVNVSALWGNVPDGTTVNVTYQALSGSGTTTAMPGVNYVLPTGNLTFVKSGSANSLTIPVTILNDNIPGDNWDFNLQLSSSDNAMISTPITTVNILNTNYPTVKFAVDSYTVRNGLRTFYVKVVANWPAGGPTNNPVSVDLSASNGTAVYGSDYTLGSQANNAPYPLTLTYSNPSQTVPITISTDPSTTDTKYFNLGLTGVVGATLGSPSSDIVWISGSGSSDTTPPTTTYSVSPTSANGQNNWYTTNVSVSLSATDNPGGSGVDHIWYNLSNGYNVKVMGNTTSFTLSANGTTTINYWAVDKEGNAETPHSKIINIDETSPFIYATLNPSSPNGISGWYNSSPNITISASDVFSGIASTAYSLDGGITWKPYIGTFNVSNVTYILLWCCF